MTDAADQYFDRMASLLYDMRTAEAAGIGRAGEMLAACIAGGGIVHIFGSGHSSLLAQEIFHRAGGLVPIDAMLDINLTVFGTARASTVERLEGYAASILASYDVRPGEVVIVLSNSGINAVPIDLALGARIRGAAVIAVTSATANANAASRHSSGQKLGDVADLVLDSHVPHGDALIDIAGADVRLGAASTVLGAALLNAVVVASAAALARRGVPVPALQSQNVPGGDNHNAALVQQYADRIPLLKP